jgi:hypothetical protein
MSESDRHIEPHVSGQELRAALAPRGRSRPSPVIAPPPAWEWSADGDTRELEEARASVAELQEEADELRATIEAAGARERALRDALARLAAARPWQRAGVRAELAARGLL